MDPLKDHIKSSVIKSLLPLTLGTVLRVSNHYCRQFFLGHQLLHNIIESFAEELLQSYRNFLTFILLMAFITIIPMNMKTLSFKRFWKNILTRIIIYSFIYCCYQIIGSLTPIQFSFNNLNTTVQDLRILEGEEIVNFQHPISTAFSIDNPFSLAVGQLLTVLNVNAMATILSKNNKYIYTLCTLISFSRLLTSQTSKHLWSLAL